MCSHVCVLLLTFALKNIGCSGGPCYLLDPQNKQCKYLIGVNSASLKGNHPMTATCVTNKTKTLIEIAKTFLNDPEQPPPNKKRRIEKNDPNFTGDYWHPLLHNNSDKTENDETHRFCVIS